MKYFKPDTNLSVCKINFVDENNVFVGFDYEHLCCEYFGWYINRAGELFIDNSHEPDVVNDALQGWVFDPKYFQKTDNGDDEESFVAVKHVAVFRLVKEDQELFLHIFNMHNGYYSHGFEMFEDGVTIHKGLL